MKKPLRSQFGYSKKTGWQDERDRDLYDAALLKWYNQPKQQGRTRTRPIHESWNEVLQLFDSSKPQRSQGAFCRWSGIDRAAFSGKQCRPIELHIVELIGVWNAQGKEVESE